MKEPEPSTLWTLPSTLWTFESQPDPKFKQPTQGELLASWREHHSATKPIFSLDGGYLGVCEKPDQPPKAFVSLDLCEVVRETAVSLARIRGGDLENVEANDAGDNSDYAMKFLGADTFPAGGNLTQFALQHLMHYDHVTPTPHADAIHDIMRNWTDQGVYIVANTSTLAGCEISTIRFLNEHYADTVRGILFPRNHDGKGTVTKASILEEARELMEWYTQFNLTDVPTIAIEDTPHHALGYVAHNSNAQVFMPEYTWNKAVEGKPNITRVSQGFGTVDTFLDAHEHMRQRGIIK